MAEPAAWHGKNLQVHGIVVPDSIARKPDSLEWRFDIQRNGKVLRAYYTGIVPDTFKADSEVVLTGTMDDAGLPRHGDDGQVPVEVRRRTGRPRGPEHPRAVGRSVTAWPRSGTTCCSPRSSCAPTPAPSRWPGRGAARGR